MARTRSLARSRIPCAWLFAACALLSACAFDPVLKDAREHFEHGFRDVRRRAADQGIELETEVVVGHPAEQIIHRAETAHADLIILGHRGKTAFKRFVIGSISEKVLRYAHCPVMVVR